VETSNSEVSGMNLLSAMFSRFLGLKEVKIVDLPGESKMYFDEAMGRWRVAGEEHLEKPEEVLAPPPKAGEMLASPPASDASKQPPTGLDALMKPPSYRNDLWSIGPKAPEPAEVSSAVGDPAAVPAARSTADGLAFLESSMAYGDTMDAAAGVGQNGANWAFTDPKPSAEEEDSPITWLCESLAAANEEPARSEAQTHVHTLEAQLATLHAHAVDLEREEQLLTVQKAQEERLQQVEAEATERRDQFEAQEERFHKVEAEAAELRDQLQAESYKSAVAEQAAAKARASIATAPFVDEDFELPDFVQRCGKTEVKQQQSQPVQQQQAVSTTAAEAIAAGVAESDGHQIAPLLALLQEKHSDLRISMKVCSALETLTFKTSEHRVQVVKQGGLKALVDLLDEQKDAGALLRPAVDTLWNLTFEEEAVEAATRVGAIERLAALMQKHRGEPVLIAGACAVLLNLAVREQNRWKIVESGSVGLVASAMQRHSDNEELMQLGSQALYILAYHQELRPAVVAASGSEAAASAAAHRAGTAQMWGRWLQEVLAC